MSQFSLAENIIVKMKQVEDELGLTAEQPAALSTSELDVWHARSINKSLIGDLAPLKNSIQHLGILQPILVVKRTAAFSANNNPNASHIIIDGYRRYLICCALNIAVPITECHLSPSQALHYLLLQLSEKPLTDYQQGIIYHHLLKEKYITPQMLVEQQRLTLTKLNQLLTYAKIPQPLISKITDLRLVSSKTAEILITLCQLGSPYLSALIDMAQKIRQGYGTRRILKTLLNQYHLPLPETLFVKPYQLKVTAGQEVIMACNDNVIRLNKKLSQQQDYQTLISTIGETIQRWHHQHKS